MKYATSVSLKEYTHRIFSHLSFKKKENIHSWNIFDINFYHQSVYQTTNKLFALFYSLNF
jgi:hypothetical protein